MVFVTPPPVTVKVTVTVSKEAVIVNEGLPAVSVPLVSMPVVLPVTA